MPSTLALSDEYPNNKETHYFRVRALARLDFCRSVELGLRSWKEPAFILPRQRLVIEPMLWLILLLANLSTFIKPTYCEMMQLLLNDFTRVKWSLFTLRVLFCW